MSILSSLTKSTTKSKKRVGRGIGSGTGGHTSGRGTKGQKSRRGTTIPLWFEGGQLPLVKRMPMLRGKGKLNVVVPTAEVTLTDLSAMKADIITLETLKLEKIIDKRFRKAKIISGEISRKISVVGVKVSKQARTSIEKAGGSVE